jgi:hypothetical protein
MSMDQGNQTRTNQTGELKKRLLTLAWGLGFGVIGLALAFPIAVHLWPENFPAYAVKKSLPMSTMILASASLIMTVRRQAEMRKRRSGSDTRSLGV